MGQFTSPVEANDEFVIKEFITYNKSFIARASLAKEQVKEYYKELKQELLSYKGVRSRISWQYDSFSYKRNKVAILTIRGNTLSLYLALDINNYQDAKYKLLDEGHKVSYSDTPVMIKIRGSRTLNYAKELIADLLKNIEYKTHKLNVSKFRQNFASKSLEELVAINLIKPIYHRKRVVNKKLLKIRIYAVVLPKVKNVNLYVVGNNAKLGNWNPVAGQKMKQVYDNFYQIDLELEPSHLEFKIVVASDYKYVEKGIWSEEIVNHHYDASGNMVVEDIIHHIHYEGELD